jgi:hypothetical protein
MIKVAKIDFTFDGRMWTFAGPAAWGRANVCAQIAVKTVPANRCARASVRALWEDGTAFDFAFSLIQMDELEPEPVSAALRAAVAAARSNAKTAAEMTHILVACDVGESVSAPPPPANQTAAEAHERIAAARLGSMAGASDDYLCQLQRGLLVWAGEITTELQDRMRTARAAQ